MTALLGLYLIVAWSSYTPLDNSWSTASFQTETINKAGAFGAWLIDAFFVFLGYVGHLIPFVIFIVPIYLLKPKRFILSRPPALHYVPLALLPSSLA